jgi:hypothetical protein
MNSYVRSLRVRSPDGASSTDWPWMKIFPDSFSCRMRRGSKNSVMWFSRISDTCFSSAVITVWYARPSSGATASVTNFALDEVTLPSDCERNSAQASR